MPATASRLNRFTESVIREMTREAHRHDAINLSQGIPDVSETPEAIKTAAKDAIEHAMDLYEENFA